MDGEDSLALQARGLALAKKQVKEISEREERIRVWSSVSHLRSRVRDRTTKNQENFAE